MQRCSIVEAVAYFLRSPLKSGGNLGFMRLAARFDWPASASMVEPQNPPHVR
jgi:hypothetical protein